MCLNCQSINKQVDFSLCFYKSWKSCGNSRNALGACFAAMFAASCRARISLLAPRHAILPAPVLASRCIATTAPVYARKKPQIPQLSKKKLAAKEKRREQKRMLQLKKKYIDNTLPLEEAIQVLRVSTK